LINIGGNSIILERYKEAITHCTKGLKIADALSSPFEQQYACECLFQAHEALGHHKEALVYHKRMVAARDMLVNEENIQRITSMEMQFTFAKEQLADSLAHAAAIAQLEDERTIEQLRADRNRNRAIASVGGGLILLLVALGWYRVDRKRRKERFEKEAATLETQALRSQMNPHFIFNALNSINAYVQQNDQESASNFLTKFARVMRSVLENSRHGEVTLSEDLDALRGYMELERMRMQGKFDFSINVAPDLDPELVLVPPLVVQPFVENAIWHGMSRKIEKGRITLSVEIKQDQLLWTIEDDGQGRRSSTLDTGAYRVDQGSKKSSLGTAITRARLDLVQKQHGGKAGFRYIDLDQGTRVEVEMPMLRAV
jgi:LytS/YehU family sensor histidine kinase